MGDDLGGGPAFLNEEDGLNAHLVDEHVDYVGVALVQHVQYGGIAALWTLQYEYN